MRNYFFRKQTCLGVPNGKVLVGWAAALVLTVSAVVGGVKAQQSAKAATMQLMKAEGDVTVSNAKGRALSIMEKMKLYNGYRTDTEEASYAWINLDDEKLTKMDAVSETEIRKNGKKLEILLKSGNLFFDVEEALTEEETLNIRTSTMTVGIRGTSGWAEVIDGMHSKIYILEGTVECTVSDPVSGEVRSATISSGETAEFVVYEGETNGKQCDILVGSYKEEEIGGFILEELAEKPALCEKIEDASGLKVAEESKKAGERLAADEAKMGAVLANIREEYAAQENHISEEPVWVGGGKLAELPEDAALQGAGQAGANVPTGGRGTTPGRGGQPVNNEITPPLPEVVVPVPLPEQKKPVLSKPDKESSSSGGSDGPVGGGTGGDETGNDIGGPGWSPQHVKNIDDFLTRLETWIEPGSYIIDKDTCPDGEVTIANGKNIGIPTGVTLTLQGVDMKIAKEASLEIAGGTLNIEKASARAADGGGNLAVYGRCAVYEGALNVLGNLDIRYTDESVQGRFSVSQYALDATVLRGGTVTVTGIVTNEKRANIYINKDGVLTVKNGLNNEGQLSVTGGEIIGDINNRTPSGEVYFGVNVNGNGKINGNVFNQGVNPKIDLANGTIKKIINECGGTNDENLDKGIIMIEKEGTVSDGIDTKGGGNIKIEKGAKINKGLTGLRPLEGFLGSLNVSLHENWENNQTSEWSVMWSSDLNKWLMKTGSIRTPCESYVAAISEVNKALMPFLSNTSGDTSVVWDVPNPASITVQEIQNKISNNKKVVMKTSSDSSTTVTIENGKMLTIQDGEMLSLEGLDLKVEEGATLSLRDEGTLEIKTSLARTSSGGNLINNGGQISVSTGGKLKVEGDFGNLQKHPTLCSVYIRNDNPDPQQVYGVTIGGDVTNRADILIYTGGYLSMGKLDNYGEISTWESVGREKIIVNGYAKNNEGAKIVTQSRVSLKFNEGLDNEGKLEADGGEIEIKATTNEGEENINREKGDIQIKNAGKLMITGESNLKNNGALHIYNNSIMTGNIINETEKQLSEAKAALQVDGELNGEVTNQGNGPRIDLTDGGEIKQIINHSTNGRITIVNGTVTDGIVTSGGGEIKISDSIRTDAQSLISGINSGEMEIEYLSVYFIRFATDTTSQESWSGYVKKKNNDNNNWIIATGPTDNSAISGTDNYSSYSAAIERVNEGASFLITRLSN